MKRILFLILLCFAFDSITHPEKNMHIDHYRSEKQSFGTFLILIYFSAMGSFIILKPQSICNSCNLNEKMQQEWGLIRTEPRVEQINGQNLEEKFDIQHDLSSTFQDLEFFELDNEKIRRLEKHVEQMQRIDQMRKLIKIQGSSDLDDSKALLQNKTLAESGMRTEQEGRQRLEQVRIQNDCRNKSQYSHNKNMKK